MNYQRRLLIVARLSAAPADAARAPVALAAWRDALEDRWTCPACVEPDRVAAVYVTVCAA
jgi:hypothetical protein